MAGAAVAVAVSLGRPILYRQRRVGLDGRPFDILKFRTMRPAGETSPAAAGDLVAEGIAPGGVEGEDRRTRTGALLRTTSIDELPQLFNVIRGEMSLVGPRPERPELVALFEERVYRYDERHRVKAGITGWAQVHGLRGNTSLADRVEWDNYYIENWSLWLDVKILLMTFTAVLHHRGV
jgi:lipopolysaccharide/colanic/teichoic acid biosynthesis glycosyltransferase